MPLNMSYISPPFSAFFRGVFEMVPKIPVVGILIFFKRTMHKNSCFECAFKFYFN